MREKTFWSPQVRYIIIYYYISHSDSIPQSLHNPLSKTALQPQPNNISYSYRKEQYMSIPSGSIAQPIIKLICHALKMPMDQTSYNTIHHDTFQNYSPIEYINPVFNSYTDGMTLYYDISNNTCNIDISFDQDFNGNYKPHSKSPEYISTQIELLNNICTGYIKFTPHETNMVASTLGDYETTVTWGTYKIEMESTHTGSWDELCTHLETLVRLYGL